MMGLGPMTKADATLHTTEIGNQTTKIRPAHEVCWTESVTVTHNHIRSHSIYAQMTLVCTITFNLIHGYTPIYEPMS